LTRIKLILHTEKEVLELKDNRTSFLKGLYDGIPIALGYIAVSFTLGIAAKKAGLTAWQAALMSITNNTSAGEFAALGLIYSGATYMELALTQFVINLRYSLMSASLTQKLSQSMPFYHRFFIAYGVTDEIYGVSVGTEGKLNPFYSYGLISMAAPAWCLGTIFGVVMGNILSANILRALSVALYGMFIAIIIPPARKNKVLAGLIIVTMAASMLFTYLPLVREISAGFRIIILTLILAGIAAVLFPVKDESTEEESSSGPINVPVYPSDGSSNLPDSSIAAYSPTQAD
jgi:predicted branched-subunit amino acid permease